jgi:hypothetical protein
MAIPFVIFEAIGAAQSVSELLDLLLKILNLQSSDVERLEKKWDIKQHADFQSAVQLLRLSRMESEDIELIDIDLLKKGLAELLKSWNYYTDLNRKGILDNSAELELVYILSGWLIARCYLKIQQYEKRQELIEDAVRYYMQVMEFIQEKIASFRSLSPHNRVVRFFYETDAKMLNGISTGNSAQRFIKAVLLIGSLVYGFPYLIIDVLVRILGAAAYGKRKLQPAFVERLNEMYIKSLIEVAPYINQSMLRRIGVLPATAIESQGLYQVDSRN